MTEAIIVALITGCLSLVGVYMANRKSAAVMEVRMLNLEKKVELHNSVIERTYRLEEGQALLEEKIKVSNHRIDDLEHKI